MYADIWRIPCSCSATRISERSCRRIQLDGLPSFRTSGTTASPQFGASHALLGPLPNSLPLIISLWRLEATAHEAKTSSQRAPLCEVDLAVARPRSREIR